MKSRCYEKIDISSLNNALINNMQDVIQVSENNYENQLSNVVQNISVNHSKCRFVLISGPSSSAKTTTAYKLKERFNDIGIHAVTISLDDFFKNRDDLEKLPNGDTDFESISTIDTERLKKCLNDLLENQESEFPIFDFVLGCRSEKVRKVSLFDNSMIIVEGIHALNPSVVQEINKDMYVTVYVSPHSEFFLNDEIILTARDIRMIRRIIRDYNYRANPVESTLLMWVNVVNSELINIIPYRDTADYKINSTISYEPCIYKYMLPLLLSENDYKNNKLNEICQALKKFDAIPAINIPDNSVLHEFIK